MCLQPVAERWTEMIAVTDLHGHRLYINAELIEQIEENPETQLVMTTGKRIYVKENADTLAEKVIAYRQRCAGGPRRVENRNE
jgi:flagellar protein FlbD